MNAPRFLRVLLAALPATALVACDRQAGTSDEHETTVAARLFLPDGQPASGARIKIYAVADTAKKPQDLVFAASDGSVRLPTDLPAGEYNLVVTDGDGNGLVIDSLLSKGAGAPELHSDTLRPLGVLAGRLQVEPQHSPRIAWVQILGVGLAANVDTAGFFRLEVPAGRITLAALTREEHYTPTFRTVKTIPDSTVDVGTVRLEYTGIPVVQGLKAIYDQSTGVVRVSWNRAGAFGIRGYGLSKYRFDHSVSIEGVDDTIFLDTIFRVESGPQLRLEPREYSVVAVDTAGVDGPSWNYVQVQAPSPWALESGRFSLDTLGRVPDGCNDVDTLGSGLVCIQTGTPVSQATTDTTAVSGFLGKSLGYNVWASDDGSIWRTLSMLPDTASSMVAWRGLVWVARGLETGDSARALPFETIARDVFLPQFGRVVVEAWNPQGRLVRVDTLVEQPGTLGERLLVRGDSLLLSSDSARWQDYGGPWSPYGLMPVARSARALTNAGETWSPPFLATFPSRWTTMVRRTMEALYTPFSLSLLDEPRSGTRWQGMNVVRVGYDLFGRTDSSNFPKWISDRTTSTPWQYRGDGENVPGLMTWNGCGLLQHLNSNRLLRICPEE